MSARRTAAAAAADPAAPADAPVIAARPRRPRRATATANFGSGRREAHDATAFYDRFVAPEVSTDATVAEPGAVDVVHCHDARDMVDVPSDSVALVVTSPPYFAGKAYEEELGVGGVPADYFEYLDLLRAVFAECKRVLEPGGRIAVNVANLGRRPYRSLSADVTTILQDLGLLLRGEVIWWKGRAAGGSCAWGTFQRPSNPVLRDVTERIVIASKGRFDRALSPADRAERGLPSTTTISRDEFMEATTDLWEIAPESATRVGHPAPFPVELPLRLIDLYTYEGDVVLDPFMGSGSTAVAAVRSDRRYVGFDTDPDYVSIADQRVADEVERLARTDGVGAELVARVQVPARPAPAGTADPVAAAATAGRQAREVAELLLVECGFTEVRSEVKPRGLGIVLGLVATDATGQDWAFDVSGGFTVARTGLRRADTLWRSLGTASVLHQSAHAMPTVLLSTDLPPRSTAGRQALRSMTGPGLPVADVIELLDADGRARLARYAAEGTAALG
ncbi:DNA-methyltransferase [Dermatobacter hominis]|uniref:DNA-methyltransferase n=1 Tax=Dermatobacter hominis TaxID=2884263 RepID=UPI001D11ECC0|nr:site-specific DNA-methyltransferase [Dermatobacter hominis]UDY34221.1 site-specific DNA-methyltransferase [Dermatobacter hominis]